MNYLQNVNYQQKILKMNLVNLIVNFMIIQKILKIL